MDIYDAIGQKIRTLVTRHLAAGYYRTQWNGRDAAGHTVASGIYFYSLRAGGYLATKTTNLAQIKVV